jgi:hypothetical protein
MSPLTIIALTSLAVLFLLLLVLIGGALIFVFLHAHTFAKQFQKDLSELIQKLREQGEANQRELVAAIAKINGEELNRAVATFVSKMGDMSKFVLRAENAALAMGEMAKLIVAEDAVRSNLGPEEYAPTEAGEGRYVSQSESARLDEAERSNM